MDVCYLVALFRKSETFGMNEEVLSYHFEEVIAYTDEVFIEDKPVRVYLVRNTLGRYRRDRGWYRRYKTKKKIIDNGFTIKPKEVLLLDW